MATIGLKVKLEDTALGPVMILLRKTPGVLGWEIEMDTLPGPATPKPAGGKKITDIALDQFALGEPVTLDQITAAVGGKSRAHGAVNALGPSKQGLIRPIPPRGTWQLTAKGRSKLGLPAQKLLPAPSKKAAKAKTNGHAKPAARAKPGATAAAMRAILAKGPLTPSQIGTALADRGISKGGLSGAMDRGKRSGLIRRLDDGRYELATEA